MKRRLWFTLAVCLQIAVLLFMIGAKWSTLTYGTKVLLKTRPVDPWDLFRGDYVTLYYEISELDLNKISSEKEEYKTNETVYVTLEQKGKYWVAHSVSSTRPRQRLAIKGRVKYFYEKNLVVNYGIESYFVPQHQGKEVEADMMSLDVEVSVDKRGNAALSRLFFKGQEVIFR